MLKLRNPKDVPGFISAMGELIHAATACVVPQAPSAEFYRKVLELNMCENVELEHVGDQIQREIDKRDPLVDSGFTREEPTKDPVPAADRPVDVSKLPPKLAAIYTETISGSTKKFCTECGMPMSGGVCQECNITEAG